MIEFHLRVPRGDRHHDVDDADVAVVLSRLPVETTARLHAVHFTDDSRGARCLGYTTTRNRREIALCAMPPRVRLNDASETQTQGFADQWREELWSSHFDHADPVHNPPSAEEVKALSRCGGGRRVRS